MGETTTVVIIAVAAVGLFLLYESLQQQAAVQNALLTKIATQQPAQSSNSLFGALTPLVGPLIAAL